ncbi:hypothetical protein BRR54_09460 [Salmonella enterica]|nr:hypothetical protein [Salmonella enterica]EBR1113836.1 hypothetical protein [Salmonella enterica]EEN6706343.1 hypothetical protein [Salmonella enterica subsp. enterica serovar Rubislaw]EID6347687.1 hypothetical protein [Salmonella enterica]
MRTVSVEDDTRQADKSRKLKRPDDGVCSVLIKPHSDCVETTEYHAPGVAKYPFSTALSRYSLSICQGRYSPVVAMTIKKHKPLVLGLIFSPTFFWGTTYAFIFQEVFMFKNIFEKILAELSGELSHIIVRQVTPIALPSILFTEHVVVWSLLLVVVSFVIDRVFGAD